MYPDTGWFIPACAGNSIELNKPIICSPVHPRLRGELRFHLLGARFLIGSSPLARGTRLNTLGSRFFRRFIPACAGNSFFIHPCRHHATGSSPLARGTRRERPLGAGMTSVHPRLRGELMQKELMAYQAHGSSPLARGTRLAHKSLCCKQRFIPACAGNSDSDSARYGARSVHPRLRGELSSQTCTNIGVSGSSPLARGTHIFPELILSSYRFIPACAGNSNKTAKRCKHHSVHPRLRGELT